MNWSKIQQALFDRGYDPKSTRSDGRMDGIPGRNTAQAVREFQSAQGLPATGVMDAYTMRRLFPSDATKADVTPPWLVLLGTKMGLHEKRDNKELREFLRSDGATLGDPAQLPWCGDLVETIIAVTLPREPLPTNPYLARNWAKFGKGGEGLGAVAVFWRGQKNGSSGHVGIAVGRNKSGSKLLIRGGNQSNMITDSWLGSDRLIDMRVPTTWSEKLPPLPVLDSSGQPVSTNEA